MSRPRLGVLLLAAAIVIAAALWVSTRRNASHDSSGVPLLPSLAREVNSVNAVLIRKGGAKPTLTLHQVDSRWTVAERGDYPADLSKLRKLMVALRDARIIEEKTADPSRYAVIGVEDPAAASAPGAEVTLVTPRGSTTLIVGKTVGDGNYVRRGGEARSFSVEPAIAVETEPRFWIDARVLDVPAALIQSMDVKPAGGAPYVLHRLNPADNTFSLDNVPAGRKAVDGSQLAPQPSMLAGLNAEDVAPLGDVNFTTASRAVVTLSDGNILTLTGTVVGDKHWLEVAATKDAAAGKLKGRAFEIASYRYDAIFRPLDQLLEPLPPKTPPVAAPARSGPHEAAASSAFPVTKKKPRAAATPAAPAPP